MTAHACDIRMFCRLSSITKAGSLGSEHLLQYKECNHMQKLIIVI
jgi:hypothetical protein